MKTQKISSIGSVKIKGDPAELIVLLGRALGEQGVQCGHSKCKNIASSIGIVRGKKLPVCSTCVA